jgi:hypothetical protein
MNENKLNDYLDEYAKTYSPEPSRALVDSIMAIPRTVAQDQGFHLPTKLSDWFLFLVPRLSGLTAACVLGLYMGSAGSSALAEDEIAEMDFLTYEVAEDGINLEENVDTLLDVEEFIFVEEDVQ